MLTNDAVKVIISDKNQRLLLQIRDARGKAVLNKSTISCFGGEINTGEQPIEAAIREVQEETGIILEPNHLQYVGKYQMASRPGFTEVYKATLDDLSIVTEVYEGSGFLIAALDEIKRSPWPISQDAREYLHEYLQLI